MVEAGAAGQPAIGLVGFGAWARHVLRDLRTLGCPVWVASRSAENRAAALAAGAAGTVERAEQLPEGLAGHVVCTPVPAHIAALLALLPRGRPVFCEKPLCDDPAAAEVLRAAAGRIFVMDKWRYHAGITALRDALRDGRWGAPLALASRRVGWAHPHLETDALWTLLPHDLSIALEILGAVAEPRQAVAEWDPAGRPVGIHAFGTAAGVPVAFEVSSASPLRERAVRVVCARATLVLAEPMADHLIVQPGSGGDRVAAPAQRLPFTVNMPLLEELRCFADHLRGGPPPRSSFAEGLAIVQACAGFRRLAGVA